MGIKNLPSYGNDSDCRTPVGAKAGPRKNTLKPSRTINVPVCSRPSSRPLFISLVLSHVVITSVSEECGRHTSSSLDIFSCIRRSSLPANVHPFAIIVSDATRTNTGVCCANIVPFYDIVCTLTRNVHMLDTAMSRTRP